MFWLDPEGFSPLSPSAGFFFSTARPKQFDGTLAPLPIDSCARLHEIDDPRMQVMRKRGACAQIAEMFTVGVSPSVKRRARARGNREPRDKGDGECSCYAHCPSKVAYKNFRNAMVS
jgi:hypothetical protein